MPHRILQRDAMRISASGRKQLRLAVAKGQTWSFDASGHWVDGWIWCGPDGYTNPLASMLGYMPQVAQAKWFCLVGQYVDDPSSAFVVGSHCRRSFSRDGEIVFFPNDMRAMRWNNFGAIELLATLSDVDGEWHGHDQEDARVKPENPSLFQVFHDKLAGVGFTLAMVLVLCALIAFMPQGLDVIRMLGEAQGGLWRSAFFVSLLFLAMQAWFWPRVVIDAALGFDRSQWRPRWLFEWGPRIFGLLPFASVAYAFGRIGSAEALPQWTVLGASLVFLVIVLGRGPLKKRLRLGFAEMPWLRRSWAEACLVLVGVTWVWSWLAPVSMGWALGAPAVAFLGVALIIPPVVCLLYLAQHGRWPIVALMVVAAIGSGLLLDNHAVGRRPSIEDWMVTSGAEVTPHISGELRQAVKDWRSVQPDPRHPVMVLVASEGGASRAGFWTAQVLGQLDQRTGGRFARHVFAINSVSGGSVGAVGYVVARSHLAGDTPVDLARLNAFVGKDALSPVLTGLLFTDLVHAFVPLPLVPDRAHAIETAWEKAWENAWGEARPDAQPGACSGCAKGLSAPFLSLAVGRQDKAWVPIPIVQGTDQMTGRRILTSILRVPIDADNFYDVNAGDVPISTAIHNGARFPLISPPGTLHSAKGDTRYIIDGGYFDASGLETIVQLREKIAHIDPAITIVTVFIGYEDRPRDATKSLWLNDPLGHGMGFWHARDGQDAHIKDRAANTPNYRRFILKPWDTFTPPMDWALSQVAQNCISASTGIAPRTAAPKICPMAEAAAANAREALALLGDLGELTP
jgi:hypothetical protein